MEGNDTKNIVPDKPAVSGDANRQPDGTFGPGNSANLAGRPKRKTLTELIHAKLDETPGGWEAIVAMALNKVLKDKDKDILKTLWNYTDGMPNQKMEHSGDIKVIITDYGTDDPLPKEDSK